MVNQQQSSSCNCSCGIGANESSAVENNAAFFDASEYLQGALFELLGVIIIYFAFVTITIASHRLFKRRRRQQTRGAQSASDRRERLLTFLQQRRILDIVDFGQTGLSLALCGFYVIETYGVSNPIFQYAEIGINAFFVVDYFLRLFISRDRLSYVFSFFAVVDVLTIIPLVFSWIGRAGNNQTPILLRLVRLSKLFRVLRSFRVLRTAPGDSFKREMFLLVFTIATLIFTSAGFYQAIESPDGFDLAPGVPLAIPFHAALYWATIEVLGRPRLAPSGATGHIMLILVVVVSIVIIPKQLARLWQVMQRDPFASRAVYRKKSDFHIVLTGHVDFPTLNMFLYETYHPERGGARPYDIVVLSNVLPDRDTQSLLLHPAYAGFVQYLYGSPQVDGDLKRAKLDEADAVFVMSNKSPSDAAWEDKQVAAIALACKAFKNASLHRSSNFDGLRRLRVLAQVSSAETRNRIQLMPGWDSRHDVCVVTEELSAAMLALAALHRGLATMVINLVSHTSFRDGKHVEDWYRQYQRGLQHEIYHCSVPADSSLVGSTLLAAAKFLLEGHGILLLAIKRAKDSASFSKSTSMQKLSWRKEHLRLFPGGDELIGVGDRIFAIARSIGHLVCAVKLSQRAIKTTKNIEVDSQPRLVRDDFTHQLTFEFEDPSESSRANEGLLGNFKVATANAMGSVDNTVRKMKQTGLESVFNTHYKGNLQMLLADLRTVSSQGVEGEDDEAEEDEEAAAITSSISAMVIPTFSRERSIYPAGALLEAQQSMESDGASWLRDHILIWGGSAQTAALVVRLIQRHSQGVPIVILSPRSSEVEAHPCWENVLDRRSVYFVHGCAENQRDLQAVKIHLVRAVIVLPCSQHGMAEHLSQHLSLRERMRIIDSDTILTTNILATRPLSSKDGNVIEEVGASLSMTPRRRKQDVWTVTQLVQDGSLGRFFGMAPEAQGGSSRFDDRWRSSAPVNIAPLFAAGHIVSATTLDRFLVESYFNPFTMLLVERLFGLAGLWGDPWETDEALSNDLGVDEADDAVPQDGARCSGKRSSHRPHAFTVALSASIVDRYPTYGALCQMLIDAKEPVLPLGLFRHPDGRYSSYSLLVSLEAEQELDFRARNYGARARASPTAVFDGMMDNSMQKDIEKDLPTHRLPFVMTNPSMDTLVMDTDLVFVLGRSQQFEGSRAGRKMMDQSSSSEMRPVDSLSAGMQKKVGSEGIAHDQRHSDFESRTHPRAVRL